MPPLPTWCWLFLFILALWQRDSRVSVGLVLVLSGLLAAFRLVPAAWALGGIHRPLTFVSFTTLPDLIGGFILQKDCGAPDTGGLTVTTIRLWRQLTTESHAGVRSMRTVRARPR